MKLKLKKYFDKNCKSNSELIGLEVVTIDGDKYFINDFDQMVNDKEMPRSLFISKKSGSNYGKYEDSDKLYIEIKD